MATNSLLEPLAPEQLTLLRTIYRPYAGTGNWPIWQYVDLTLDAAGLDAAAVLASLPTVRRSDNVISARYGLTWSMDAMAGVQPDKPMALTVAGLSHLEEAQPLTDTFMAALRYLIDQQRRLVPSATQLVEATVTTNDLSEALLTASVNGSSAPPVDQTLHKLYQLLEHEPMSWGSLTRPSPDISAWQMRVPARLRELRGVSDVSEYIERIVAWIAPPSAAPEPDAFGAPELPHAVGYLDAVWKSQTGGHLFVQLDPASIARLTEDCGSEADFNSLLSALADVLGQVVTPGRTKPPQSRALEAFGEYLTSQLEADAAERVSTAIGTLIRIRHLRVSSQHSDARHRAVAAFNTLGLPFPPVSWNGAWLHVGRIARASLDIVREEVHAGMPGRPWASTERRAP